MFLLHYFLSQCLPKALQIRNLCFSFSITFISKSLLHLNYIVLKVKVKVTQSCLTLCGSMDCRMPGFPVHHQLPELTQTHVLPVGDDIQPSYPLSSPSLAFNHSQHQGFFTSGGQSIGVSASTSVLPMNTQDQSFGWNGWMSLQFKGFSRVFSNTTVQKHQFFSAQLSL